MKGANPRLREQNRGPRRKFRRKSTARDRGASARRRNRQVAGAAAKTYGMLQLRCCNPNYALDRLPDQSPGGRRRFSIGIFEADDRHSIIVPDIKSVTFLRRLNFAEPVFHWDDPPSRAHTNPVQARRPAAYDWLQRERSKNLNITTNFDRSPAGRASRCSEASIFAGLAFACRIFAISLTSRGTARVGPFA